MKKIINIVSIISLLFFNPYFALPVRAATCDSLVSWWSMDEASGTRTDSVVASGNDLTDNNAVASAVGKVSNAADFERGTANQYLSIADASQAGLDITTAFSISLWFKPESLDGELVAKYNSGNNTRSYKLSSIVNGLIQITISDDGTTNAGHSMSFLTLAQLGSTGTWYHVVATVDVATETAVIYVNGSSVGVTPAGTIGASLYNSAADFTIGAALSSGTPVDEVDGIIDEVGIWSRVITSGEVTTLYNSGNGISYATACAAIATPPITNDVILFEEE